MALSSGRASVTTPGTAVRLSTDALPMAETILVTAFTDNSDYVVVGASNVVASHSTRIGHPLSPGVSVVLGSDSSPVQPGDVYVDAVVSGEGVTWVAI